MLTKELAIAVCKDGVVFADRLFRLQHHQYEALARQMLDVYQQGVGLTRRELHNRIRSLFQAEHECPLRRMDAFCKLLDESSKFQRDRRGTAAQLRQEVFRSAAPSHPLVAQADTLFESTETVVKSRIASEMSTTWESISERLFSDVIPNQKLLAFTGYPSPSALLARYNVAQSQAVLYQAESLTIWAKMDLKIILRYAKLARLVHSIEPLVEGGYRLYFDGPASILRSTSRYGVAMARFLPALLSCREWQMEAKIRFGRHGWYNRFSLTSKSGLQSTLPPPEDFDSKIEAHFAMDWEAVPHEHWRMSRETVVLHEGQKTFIPDFVFDHDSGRRVLLEIAGFWTPEYLANKQATLQRFVDQFVLMAVPESLLNREPSGSWVKCSPGLVVYKSKLKARDIVARLESLVR